MTQAPAKFTAHMIQEACSGRLAAGHASAGVQGVSIDTRTLRAEDAFFALVGGNHDGHRFVPQAMEAGASIVVAQKAERSWRIPAGSALILVEDTTRALSELAAWHRGRLGGRLIAVTGSCGKSTVKSMIGTMLGRSARCTAAKRSFNNTIGLSVTLLEAGADDAFVVVEIGANHFGEIDALARCARPHAAVVTCIGDCHLEGFGSRRGVREAKAEIIPHLDPNGLLAVSADDALCLSLGERFGGEVMTFGMRRGADVCVTHLRPDAAGASFRACGAEFRLPVPGRHNVLNAAAALCACVWAGVEPKEASEALTGFALLPLRFERRSLGGVEFVLDCYNSNPTAMQAALHSYLQQPAPRRRVVVCGDMLELGEAAPEMHGRLGRLLALASVDVLVAVGPLGKHVTQGWSEMAPGARRAFHFASAEQAWRPIWELLAAGDTVLLKGSRAMELERIPAAIQDHLERAGKEAAA